MAQTLQLLIAEDSPADAELLLRALQRAGFEPVWKRVDTEVDFLQALRPDLELVLSDYEMPQFSGLRALELLKQSGLDVPFIIVSGTIGEDTAVAVIKQGAADYLLKDRLVRIGAAVSAALAECRLRRAQRETLKALHESEQRLQLVTGNARVGLVMVNRDRCYTFANATYAEILGLPSADITGRRVADILGPLYETQVRPRLDCAFAGERVAYELEKSAAGGTRYYAVRYEPTKADGSVTLVVVVIMDITERRQAEQAQRESEARFASAFRSCPAPIAISRRRDLIVLEINEAFARLFECPREEIVGRTLVDAGLLDQPTVQSLQNQIARTGEISDRELPVRTRTGKLRQVSLAVRVIQMGGEVCSLSILVDVTERNQALETLRESEQRFRQMAESIDEVFWMTDTAKNEMLYISPGYERIWNRRCEELYAAPQTWIEAIVPEDRARVQAAAVARQTTGDYREEYRIVRPDGTMRWILDRAFPVKDAGGKVYRVVGVAEDITERKKLEEQFLHAQRMEAIGTLAGGMAHDLNNILAPVLMVAGLLKAKLASPQDQHILSMVESSAQRGAGIVRQLLMFSRGVAGERIPVQWRHLIKEMAGIMRETFPREITIHAEPANNLWPVVGDATQLHQVLMNLCVNARDAMTHGGLLIVKAENLTLTAEESLVHPKARAGRYVVLSVEDTGQGIPAEILGKIFDPFFTTKGIGKGTGLGLSTVIGIVNSHDGFVTVHSEPGKGTVFKVHLPATESAGTSQAEGREASDAGHGELILIVDDELPVSEATSLMLQQHNYKGLTASNGKEAVALFLEHQDRVKLVITDIMMPVMGGLALIRALRAIAPGFAIIATTGLDQEGKAAELKELDVTEVLLKPCAPNDLLAAVRRELDRAQGTVRAGR